MGRQLKCILCEMVCHSKQEMDEHMRSMLHHRELENLKGRDCGHECKVCQVTVVSLTDYASHISSPKHKQNVEAAEHKSAGNDLDEEYFDQQLVELIEKRKKTIRREEEAAAAKRDKEEAEQRKQQEFAKRLQEAKERFQLDCTRLPPPRNVRGPNWHGPWNGGSGGRAGEGTADSRPWHQTWKGKSATWHAQEPPSFRSWESGELAGGSFRCQDSWGNNQWAQPGLYGNQRGPLPWLSNKGSSNGIYGRNNIGQFPNRPQSHRGPPPCHPPPPMFFSRPLGQMSNRGIGQKDRMGDGHLNKEGPKAECNGKSNMNPKTFGSNPKVDKVCRWAPYPPAKNLDTAPQKQGPSEKHPKLPTTQDRGKAQDASASKRQISKPISSSADGLDRLQRNDATNRRSSGSSSNSAQREGNSSSLPGPSKQRADNPSEHRVGKHPSVPSDKTPVGKGSSQGHEQPKSTIKSTRPSMKALPIHLLRSRQDQLLSGKSKAKDKALDKNMPVDTLIDNRVETVLHIVEEQQAQCPENQAGANKENACEQDSARGTVPALIRPSPCEEDEIESVLSHSSDSHRLQSTQVDTCTGLQPPASGRPEEEEEEEGRQGENQEEGQGESQAGAAVSRSPHAGDAGHGSESDSTLCGEPRAASGSSAAAGLSKLGLPPVLKRDLTKHISSKSKALGHEPNLNIARRVRNLSESRKGESDKDSALKPTVRQLISSSGSRRNVNWEQLYQEVRKKQEQGKGMPRFGIEMVAYDHEEHSQEEDHIALLEGFQWEALMDGVAPTSTRKCSLSESSVAPERSPALFPSQASGETAPREAPTSPCPSKTSPAPDHKGRQRQQEARALQEGQVRTHPVAEEVWPALHRSDSCSSGTELCDGPGTGKKRRAAGEVPSPDIPSLERKTKRRKVKPKKERLQVDQLLAVSLKEEELSRSLHTVDSNLIQARAALEAAYLEVQRLLVVKQQVTTEMSTLRNERIKLLKGIQGGLEDSAQPKVKEEKMECVCEPPPATAHTSVPQCSLTPRHPAVSIKQEPVSPVCVSPEPEAMERSVSCAHSTTPELAAPPGPGYSCQSPPGHGTAQATEAACWEPETRERAVQATRAARTPPPDCKLRLALSLLAESAAGPLPSGRRVRRLRKRKAVRPTQGEQWESSDTEVDQQVCRPRRVRLRHRPSAGSPTAGSPRGGSPTAGSPRTGSPRAGSPTAGSPRTGSPRAGSPIAGFPRTGSPRAGFPRTGSPTAGSPRAGSPTGAQEEDRDPGVEVWETEESMEVTMAGEPPFLPDPSGREPRNLACNGVTSTCDIDMSCVVRLTRSEIPLEVPKRSKTSSEVSCDVDDRDVPTEGAFVGHQEAVNGMQILKGLLYTCSGDRTVRAFDLPRRECVAVFEGHSSKVNCLLASAAVGVQHRLYTGSSDQTIRCYSLKAGECEQQFSLPDRVLCLHSRWKFLYAGLGNGTVVTFSLKTNKQLEDFECHGARAVSCLASGQEGARKLLLVGSYDSTISVRDAKSGLLLRTLEGHTKTVLCMTVVNDLVFSGSSDQLVHAYNIYTGELVRVYKGHRHAVTVVTVLGKLMVTACLDKLIRIYDLQSQECLQVYGGHKDMVMCMTVHNNMIYTGCYDGSVEAVKLNLMQNYPCLWHGCSMVFGVTSHLQQHLLDAHTGVSKCRWKTCEELLCCRSSSKQAVLMHMQKHAEEDP